MTMLRPLGRRNDKTTSTRSQRAGAMSDRPGPDLEPVWFVDDRLITSGGRPPWRRPGPQLLCRWLLAPFAWREPVGARRRLGALAWRAGALPRLLRGPGPGSEEP